ncbi:Fic family protein [Adlercreutzia equolifaciens]|uniref:Fic family protein n=1 Tax=Adlercreutzia equolifaciens TaxID=446660 RepID=UPI0023B0F7C9|nr:Fic family protein [Adlercreutzia equolifaciens]MDE8702897.1 Fic family protein [Adlercreutzia equolifaciens]
MAALLEEYRRQQRLGLEGNIYHKTQVELAYNSNHIEGSRLTEDQTRQIFETRTIDGHARLADIQDATNHFRLFDQMLEIASDPLTVDLLLSFHETLKRGTQQAESDPVFQPGVFKTLPNEVGGVLTTPPVDVPAQIQALLEDYEGGARTFEAIVDFHARFERIHPFQDGNGRIGRMLMFKECLRIGIVPFIVRDDMKQFYYRGLANYGEEPGWLLDTCRSFQDDFQVRFLPLVPHVSDAE